MEECVLENSSMIDTVLFNPSYILQATDVICRSMGLLVCMHNNVFYTYHFTVSVMFCC